MSPADRPTVLIVEDERQLADLYERWLEDTYAVRIATEGEEAVRSLDRHVDVVLLDRRIPGISGDEVLEMIRDRGYACKVAMVTAVEPDFDILEMGFDDYLVKPVTKAEVRATVERLLARSTYGEQLDEYARLLAKKVALETEKDRRELAGNEAFAALEARVERLGSNVDELVGEFDRNDVVAVLRDLSTGQEQEV